MKIAQFILKYNFLLCKQLNKFFSVPIFSLGPNVMFFYFMLLATFLVILLDTLQKLKKNILDKTYSVCEPFRAHCEAVKNFILKIDITEDHATKF